MPQRHALIAAVLVGLSAALAIAALALHARFRRDLDAQMRRASQHSTLLDTACGRIEVQQAGAGPPLLVVHGSGGGHDQGMDFAHALGAHGLRIVSVSRFGYLRTPRPADASPQAQGDAHVCVLDALGIPRAAVLGISAGAASALQAALRHPSRVSALVLVVPILHKPDSVADSAPAVSDEKDRWLLRLLGSDFLYWLALKLAPDQVFRHVLATPPELIAAATEAEQARVARVARHVLPLSSRAQGLLDDTRLGKHLGPLPLATIRTPTLLISARDDGFGTYAGAEYTAQQIPGARFVGYERGGHLLVGHEAAIHAEIIGWLQRQAAAR